MAYNIYRYVTLALWGAVIGATVTHIYRFFKYRDVEDDDVKG